MNIVSWIIEILHGGEGNVFELSDSVACIVIELSLSCYIYVSMRAYFQYWQFQEA